MRSRRRIFCQRIFNSHRKRESLGVISLEDRQVMEMGGVWMKGIEEQKRVMGFLINMVGDE